MDRWFQFNFCYSNDSYNVEDKEYYQEFHGMCKYYLLWILPLIIIVGILGSVFCVIFLLCSKLFPKNLLIWLVSICVGDLMILLLDGIWIMLKMWIGYDIRDVNNLFCKSHKFLSNYFFYWSAYMQTMVSLQRAYLIMQPIQARLRLTMPRLISIWFLLSVLLIFPHIIYLTNWKVKDGDCDPDNRKDFYVTSLCDLIIWGCIPFMSMVLSTCIICINVCSFQTHSCHHDTQPRLSQCINNKNKLTSPKMVYSFVQNNSRLDPKTVTTQFLTDDSSNITNLCQPSPIRLSSMNNSTTAPEFRSTTSSSTGRRHGGVDTAKHVTQLLIGMNLCYLLSTFPLLIFLFYTNFIDSSINKWRFKFFYYLLRSLTFYNTCTNWILYCAAGHLFRSTAKRLLVRLFCCSCSNYNNSTNSHQSVAIAYPNKYVINHKN